MWARLLWLIAMVGLVFWWLRNRRSLSNFEQEARGQDKAKMKSKKQSLATVACAHCGLIVPSTEALTLPGLWAKVVSRERLYFCCQDHVMKFQQNQRSRERG